MKLKYKTFLIYSAIAIFPMVLLTFFSFYQYTHIINRRMTEISNEQQNNITKKIEESYSSVKQVLMFLTFANSGEYSMINILRPYSDPDRPLTDYEIYSVSKNLEYISQDIFYTYNYVNGVYIFTPSKSQIAYTTNKDEGIPQTYDPEQDDWYQDTINLNGKLYISALDEYPMFQSDRKRVFFAQSIIDIDTRKFLGVLVLDCSPSLFDLSSANVLGDMNLISLKNPDNDSVYYTNLNDATEHISRNNKNAIVTPVDNTPFEVSLTFDYASLRAEYASVIIMLIIFSAICIICILFLSFSISSSLVRPIQQLSDQMLHQRSTHLTSFADYSGRKDEIGILYREYNNMIEELNASIRTEYQNKLITLDAQMKSLEARINSHFLFNTLESINSMAELADQEQISIMSLALGNMFRYAIKTKSELVTLQQELEHVFDYVNIQKIRYDNRFQLKLAIDHLLYSQRVLKLILQPLVENSLIHGLNYCNAGDTICISALIEPPNLYISISDNGLGISEEQLSLLRENLNADASFTELGVRTKQSIGLKNIQSRIELYYGKGYGLSIESEIGKGTCINIKIPVLPQRS